MVVAVAGVVGAALETLAASLGESGSPWRTATAWVGAAVLTIVPIVTASKTSKEQVERWVRARSASEGLKQQIYRFLVGGKPYGAQRDVAEFTKQRETIEDQVKDLARYDQGAQPVLKPRPTSLTINEYLVKRVEDQIKYYRESSVKNARRAGRLRQIVFGLGILAALAGLFAGGASAVSTGLDPKQLPPFVSGVGPWVAVLTTTTAAVIAYLAAGRYDELSVSYSSTASRLRGLRDVFGADKQRTEQARIEQFVDDVESAISAENEGWRAGWKEDKPQTPPPVP
jgi:hypothetical protein